MDHSPYPAKPIFPSVIVKHHDTYTYDAATFADYRARCGFDKSRQSERPLKWVPPESRTSFFQAWLFFGVLHEVLDVNQYDFVIGSDGREDARVSAERLPHYLELWTQRVSQMRSRHAHRELLRCRECLLEACAALNACRSQPDHGVEEVVICSIIDVGIAVTYTVKDAAISKPWLSAFQQIPGLTEPSTSDRLEELMSTGNTYPEWPVDQLAGFQLRQTNRCPSEQRRVSKSLASCTILYCAVLPILGRSRDHSHC